MADRNNRIGVFFDVSRGLSSVSRKRQKACVDFEEAAEELPEVLEDMTSKAGIEAAEYLINTIGETQPGVSLANLAASLSEIGSRIDRLAMTDVSRNRGDAARLLGEITQELLNLAGYCIGQASFHLLGGFMLRRDPEPTPAPPSSKDTVN